MNKTTIQIEKKQVFDTAIAHADQPTVLQRAQHFDDDKTIIPPESPMTEEAIEALLPEMQGLETHSTTPRRRTWLAKGALLGIVVLVLVETSLSLLQAWLQSRWLFGLYAGVALLVGGWVMSISIREWRQLKRLRAMETAQAVSERLAQSVQRGEADAFIKRIIGVLPDDIDKQSYYALVRDEHNDAERLMLFESSILPQLDTRAKKLVHRYASESALLLAASPIALLDMALILWRNQKMIAQLAACYGIELGYWSRISLIRSVITNIIYAGTSEVVTDIGTQLFSLEMSGKLSARLAQGLGGGLLTARLGYQTMRLCRPVAFSAKTRPRLTKIHRALLAELKDFSLSVLGKTPVRNRDFTSK